MKRTEWIHSHKSGFILSKKEDGERRNEIEFEEFSGSGDGDDDDDGETMVVVMIMMLNHDNGRRAGNCMSRISDDIR